MTVLCRHVKQNKSQGEGGESSWGDLLEGGGGVFFRREGIFFRGGRGVLFRRGGDLLKGRRGGLL